MNTKSGYPMLIDNSHTKIRKEFNDNDHVVGAAFSKRAVLRLYA